ncbi:MAG TPA: hypothetical protein VHI50_16175 [Micromonosporaceae bacterium]|jgi:hypothetical protein|nr:hypothetical protein [Micromonosporaceae bacterium]
MRGFAPAATDAGVRAVFALPLQIGAIRLGVLGDVAREVVARRLRFEPDAQQIDG